MGQGAAVSGQPVQHPGWSGQDPGVNKRWPDLVEPTVIEAADRWPLGYRIEQQPGPVYLCHTVCGGCGQAVLTSRRQAADTGGPHDRDNVRGPLLAHLMQRHGWSRERIGDRS